MQPDKVKALPTLQRLAYWIEEREKVRKKKEAGKPAPWTDDPILRRYRFCNVHREDDRVTRWISQHWRTPNQNDPNLWHAMMVARMLNWPDTLDQCGYPEPWDKKRITYGNVLKSRQLSGQKVFTGAYIISTNGIATDKVTYVLKLFDQAWQERKSAEPKRNHTLAGTHQRLMKVNGLGSFLAAQIIADLKQTPILKDVPDWWSWAAPGPGSARGLLRLKGVEFGAGKRAQPIAQVRSNFVAELCSYRDKVSTYSGVAETVCLQDFQNCLCEFDKYERVLWGEGRPRATYTPHTYTTMGH
jgi:hypothetical protein